MAFERTWAEEQMRGGISERPDARVRMLNPSQKRVFLLLLALAEFSRQQTISFWTTGE